jgi:hypothetical protein
MTDDITLRQAQLEKLFADGKLSQDELDELEILRDEAGQGWLFESERQERAQEPIRDCAAEIARRQGVPLRGQDGGEQADLFGQGLLL